LIRDVTTLEKGVTNGKADGKKDTEKHGGNQMAAHLLFLILINQYRGRRHRHDLKTRAIVSNACRKRKEKVAVFGNRGKQSPIVATQRPRARHRFT
jgi:ribosomal protein S13